MQLPNFVQKTMRMYRLTLSFIIILTIGGLYSLYVMPKEEFPDFEMPMALMVAVYPGASAEQVENEVLTKLEDYVYSFQGIRKDMMSFEAYDGICYGLLFTNPDCKDAQEVWNDINAGLPMLQKLQLPPGVLGVVLLDNMASVPTMLISLDSKDKNYRELEDYAERLRTKLRNVEDISDLSILGSTNEQISIYLDKNLLSKYSINKSLIQTQMVLQGLTLGGSHVNDDDTSVPIYVTNTFQTVNNVAQQIIFTDPMGRSIRLKDVATIRREYPDRTSYIANNGNRCLLLQVQMKSNQNITFFGNHVTKIVKEFKKTLPSSIHLNYIVNQPSVVNRAVLGFLSDLLEAVIIVILVMMVLFPIRSALVAGISIPFTMLFTLFTMYNMDIPLNTVTLAALIVVLGMVVDDGIVIIDNYQHELHKHHSCWYASVMGTHKMFASVSLATLSICFVFLPWPIIMPKMLYNIVYGFVATLTIAMMCSLFTAIVLVPILSHWLLGKSTSGEPKLKESRLLKPIEQAYNWLLSRCFRYPWVTIGLGTTSVVLGALLLLFQPITMLPSADRNQLVVEIYNPPSSSCEKTAQITDSVAAIMKRDPRVVSVTEFVGQLMPRFMVTAPVAMGGNSFSQMIVTTKSNNATIGLLNDYTGYFGDMWPGTFVNMQQLSYCPANGVQLNLFCEDLKQLHAISDSVKLYLHKNKDIIWIENAADQMIPSVDIDLDKISAERLGVTETAIASDMALQYGGFKIGSLWEGSYQMPVYIYNSDREQQHDIGGVADNYVSALGGNVPLRQIADVHPAWHEASIKHMNCQKCMSLKVYLVRGASTAGTISKIKKYLGQHPELFPRGARWEMSGTEKINKLIVPPMMKSLLFSVLIILFIMILNFQKVSLAALSMIGVSFALPGAALGQWLSGFDLGLTSALGLCSLLGIAMRNSIIMFDYAQELRHHGMSAREAAYNAGKRRMTPIFLTAATTAVGVVPIMVGQSALWTPMGWIICFGTFFATFLMVIIMPVAYWKLLESNQK